MLKPIKFLAMKNYELTPLTSCEMTSIRGGGFGDALIYDIVYVVTKAGKWIYENFDLHLFDE